MPSTTSCAKCGACTAVCPVYKVCGRESRVARGKIHLLENMPKAARSNDFSEIFQQCLLCGACADVCPRELDIPGMIIEARAELSGASGRNAVKKYLAAKTLASPMLLKSVSQLLKRTAAIIDTLPGQSGLHLRLIDQLPDDIEPSKPYINSRRDASPENPKVAFFSGCVANYLYPQIAGDTDLIVKYFTSSNAAMPSTQNCCGLAAYSAGDIDAAQKLAKKNISAFCEDESINKLPILTTCASCFSHLKDYEKLLAGDPAWSNKAVDFSNRVVEFSSWLLERVSAHELPKPPVHKAEQHGSIFYHDPCHLRFHHKVSKPPRQIIEKIFGAHPAELPGGAQCCGMGGLFHLAYPRESKEILKNLTAEVVNLHIKTVTTTCSGCLLQLKSALKNTPSVTVTHLARLIAGHLKVMPPGE